MIKKITLLFTFLFSISVVLQAQTTAIPDANFENKLIDLGIDTNGANGNILNSDALAVTVLFVINSNISDLTGIEAFTNLTLLDCGSNNLTSINVSQNTLLESLDCSFNSLQIIDVSQNTQLTYLHLDDNDLQELNVYNNTQLEILFCRRNNLQTITFSNIAFYPSLESIYCSFNQLTALDPTYITGLREIYCEYNQILSIDFSVNTNLEILNCSNNQLQAINISNCTQLERLYCRYNQISHLNLSLNTSLEKLWVSNNNLNFMDLRNGNYENLTLLRINSNPNLTCIYVDDVAYYNTNWSDAIDATSTYVVDEAACSSLALNELTDNMLTIYPNPTKGLVNVKGENIQKIEIIDILGRIVNSTENNIIDLSVHEKGNYFLKIYTDESVRIAKILLE
jgi:hypothetical protein